MRATTQTVSTVTSGAWIPLDTWMNPFNVSLAVVVTGTINYTVQFTLDNVLDSTVTPTAFDLDDLTSKTASDTGNFMFPVKGVRLKVNSVSGGSATLTVLQAGGFE